MRRANECPPDYEGRTTHTRAPGVTAAAGAESAPAGFSGWADRTFTSLRVRDFRFLWLGMLSMMGGMNMQMMARAQLAWDLTHSEIAISLVGAGFAPPILILSIFGGAMADRLDRKRVIQTGQFITMGLAVVIGMLILTHHITLWWLVGASIGQGIAWAFLMPARQAIVPQLVGRAYTSNAIALNAGAMSLMTLIAPGIAGVLYGRVGAAPTYFIIAGFHMVAVLLTTFVPSMIGSQASRPAGRVLGEMVDGVKYTSRNRTVLWLLLVALFTTVLAQPFRSLMPAFVSDLFGRGPEAVGLMLSSIGLGALLGTIFIAGLREGEHRGLILLITTAVSGLALMLATLSPSYMVAVGVMALLGLGDSGRRSLNSALMLEQTDEDYRGRVMGLYMMNFGLIPLGAIPLAAIAEAVGIRWAVAGSGALLIAAAVSTMLVTNRVRRL